MATKSKNVKKTTRRPAKRKAKGQTTTHMLLGVGAIGSVGALIGAGIYKLLTLQ